MIKIIFLTRTGTCNFSLILSQCYAFTQALDARVTNITMVVVPYANPRIEWLLTSNWPVPVAARVCGRSLVGVPGWNLACGMDLCLL
jgi:hypothetical protein